MKTLVSKGIKKYQSYERYITEVVESTDEFNKKVDDIITRHKTLKDNLEKLKTEVAA